MSAAEPRIDLPDAPSALQSSLDRGGAIAWSEPVTISTYRPAGPDRYPMFLSRRVYQGSSGRVYPIPFTDRIETTPVAREWQAIHLENRWIRLMILPELGGRIHVGFDKSAGYDFFYRNNVIKPALVGLAGPWVSGGVEFNWPQHHRPATFMPVDVEIEQHDDGSVTVWCSDHDPFTRMKGLHGVRLHPDRSTVELVVRLHNRTSLVQTFLWWANVAARVHDDYQSFFPTDVRYVADHARRAMVSFPIADRPYYGVDYPARAATGGDRLDFYRNIPVPTSYMIVNSAGDFFGGYDHKEQAGFVHVADHRVAPGKKQWTWGNAPFGHAWDTLLTDSDGPYVELMAGVYTDNQPDFSWLAPGETKTFTQTWFPIQKIGVVHEANTQAAVHLHVENGTASIGVITTSSRPDARVLLRSVVDGSVLYQWAGAIAPDAPHVATAPIGILEDTDIELQLLAGDVALLSWRPPTREEGAEPAVATEPPRPVDIESLDELYLTGLHLAQYRHPTRSPLPYWLEGIARDAGDARCNLALADHFYRQGEFDHALDHAERARDRLTVRNGNPRDGEVWYLLGLIQHRRRESQLAADAFAKAGWDGKWAHAALFELARIEAAAGRDHVAFEHVRQSRRMDTEDSRARALEVVLLRRLGKAAEAKDLLEASLEVDPLDQLARALRGLPLSQDPKTVIDVALDLRSFGELDSARRLLKNAAVGSTRQLALYHLAELLHQQGLVAESTQARADAARSSPLTSFPSGLDDERALRSALDADGADFRAHALLGMLLYDRDRRSDALKHWAIAIAGGLDDPVTLRNAAIATYNLSGDGAAALELFEDALALAPGDARLWYESDRLLAITEGSPERRIERLAPQLDVLFTRDDATIEWCDLLTETGRAAEALHILSSRRFAPWEGGEGRALASWESACLACGRAALAEGDPPAALAFADAALNPPATLGEARHLLAATDAIESLRTAALPPAEGLTGAGEPKVTVPAEASAEADPDYFATSLPELLLFDWRPSNGRAVS